MKEIGYAKINLGLKVLGKRPDGYHAVDMIMQTISFADILEITPADNFLLTMDDPELPTDNRNLAYKAAELISAATGRPLKVHLHINKNIFKAAGLAGGSTDAAAVLRGLNTYWQAGLSQSALEKLGEKLGSDIPFCVRGGTARATGRGEVLESLPDIPSLWLVLVKPLELDVSTAWVYQHFSAEKCENNVDIDTLVQAINSGQTDELLTHLGNDLESVTLPAHPQLIALKDALKEQGAKAVLMSGSGPTIFGVVASEEEANKIAQAMQTNFPVAAVAACTGWRDKK